MIIIFETPPTANKPADKVIVYRINDESYPVVNLLSRTISPPYHITQSNAPSPRIVTVPIKEPCKIDFFSPNLYASKR